MDLRRKFADYLTVLPGELGLGDEDPAAVLDRYYTPDIEYRNDGVLLDRQRLLDHVRPARRNAADVRIEVDDLLVDGHTAAARFTLHAVMRRGGTLSTQVYLFARLTPEGLVRRVEAVTRTLRS